MLPFLLVNVACSLAVCIKVLKTAVPAKSSAVVLCEALHVVSKDAARIYDQHFGVGSPLLGEIFADWFYPGASRPCDAARGAYGSRGRRSRATLAQVGAEVVFYSVPAAYVSQHWREAQGSLRSKIANKIEQVSQVQGTREIPKRIMVYLTAHCVQLLAGTRNVTNWRRCLPRTSGEAALGRRLSSKARLDNQASLLLRVFQTAAAEMRLTLERNEYDPPRHARCTADASTRRLRSEAFDEVRNAVHSSRKQRAEQESRIAAIQFQIPDMMLASERIPTPSVAVFFVSLADEDVMRHLDWRRTISLMFKRKFGKTSKVWNPNPVTETIVELTSKVSANPGYWARLAQVGASPHAPRSREGGGVLIASGGASSCESFFFFEAMEDLTADPDKYAKTSIAQVAKADKELRIEERASTNRSIVRTLTGIYPLEAIWKVTL